MSVRWRIPDGLSWGAEGQLMTQSVNREFLGLDRFGPVSLLYSGLETIRYQTLPMRSQISGYRAKAALP